MRFIGPVKYNKYRIYDDGDVVIGKEGGLWVLSGRYWRRRGRRVK